MKPLWVILAFVSCLSSTFILSGQLKERPAEQGMSPFRVGVTQAKQAGGGEDKKPEKKPSAIEIENLIKQLGDKETRGAASKALVKIGEQAVPELLATQFGPDPAMVPFVEGLIVQIDEAYFHGNARTQMKVDRAAKYGIDVLAERMLKKGKDLTDEDWRVLFRIMNLACTDAKALGVKDIRRFTSAVMLTLPFRATPVEDNPFGEKGRKRYVCRNSRLVAESIKERFEAGGSAIICGGQIDVGPGSCCILTNGDMRATGVANSILICDGDVWLHTVQHSIVIASGRIKIRAPLSAKEILIREKYSAGFSKIRFFSPSDLGVQIAGEETGAFAINVEPDSLLGKKGLKPGQQFWSINGAKPKDADEARRMLRSGIAEGRLVIEMLGLNAPVKIDFPW